MPESPTWTSIAPTELDLAGNGIRYHRIRLSDGPIGSLELPLAVIRNGSGPTVLVAGGTHGDEFEGQIVAGELLRNADLGRISGLLVVLPLHNVPACLAGTRTGADGADLNRLYPPSAEAAGPGASISRFVSETILPAVDWVVDLHSGGQGHEFVLSGNLQATPGSAEYRDMLPTLFAFDAPYGLVFDEAGTGHMPHTGTLEGLARRLGKHAISSELGGGGRATPESLAVARRGLRNVLAHIGVCADGAAVMPEHSRSVLIGLTRPEHYVRSPIAGRLAPLCRPGDDVRAGDVLGDVHPLADPLASPVPVVAPSDGVVAAVAANGIQGEGASVFFIAEYLE